jgi:hypothetical protein
MTSHSLSPITLQDSPHDATDEAYERELSSRMHQRQDAVVDRFLELLADHCYRRDGNALATMHTLLSGEGCAPIRDDYDARQYSLVGRPDDASLAALVRHAYAVANLSVALSVREELSDVPF